MKATKKLRESKNVPPLGLLMLDLFFCCFLILDSISCNLFHPVIIAQLCSWGRKTAEPDIRDLLLLPF